MAYSRPGIFVLLYIYGRIIALFIYGRIIAIKLIFRLHSTDKSMQKKVSCILAECCLEQHSALIENIQAC